MASSTTTSTISRIHNDPYPKVPKDTLIDPFPHTAIGDASCQIDIQSDIEISAGRDNLSYSNMSTAAGPSGSNASTSTNTLPPQASSSVHVHPHGAHLDRTTGAAVAGIEDDEHDYESLPEGYGWAVNMAAGALVRSIPGVVCVGVLISSLFRPVFRNTLSSSPSTL